MTIDPENDEPSNESEDWQKESQDEFERLDRQWRDEMENGLTCEED